MKIPQFFKTFRNQREKDIAKLLSKSFKISYRRIDYYLKALRHKSAARNIHNEPDTSNERLEFLGDAILDAVVADYLYTKYPDAEEGELTQMKSRIVSRSNLNSIAQTLGIDKLIETDTQAMHSRNSISGNAIEALFGAIYLDLRYEACRKSILYVLNKHGHIDNVEDRESDFKSRLYEEAHRMKVELRFQTQLHHEEKGVKTFISKALFDNNEVGKGTGSSKKKAEQKASEQGLAHLNTVQK